MNQEQETNITINVSENDVDDDYDYDYDDYDDYISYKPNSPPNSPEQQINSTTKNTEKRVTYNEEQDDLQIISEIKQQDILLAQQERVLVDHEKLLKEEEEILSEKIRVLLQNVEMSDEILQQKDELVQKIKNITQVKKEVRDKLISIQKRRLLIKKNKEKLLVKEQERISRQAYQYDVSESNKPHRIPGVIPQADDNSSENDISGNMIDPDGNKIKNIYKKFTYKEVEEKIFQNFFDDSTDWSSSLDIIGTYLRGQKLIYMESKSYCENKLNRLMMPSIFLSTAATVLSAIVKDYYWGAYLIASVNGLIAFLLAIVNYLKLDAASEAHKITSHQYDKLQSKTEFLSGQILLFNNTNKEMIQQEMENVKKKIEEIKETNRFIVPKKVRTLYPIMFNTNVFLIVKKINDITKKKINKIKDLKNEKNYLIEVLKSKETKDKDKKILRQIEARISECENEKRRHEENIVVLKSSFSTIDEMYMKEMENAEKYKKMKIRRFFCCGFGIKDQLTDPRDINKFILDIMNPYRDKIEEDNSSKKVNTDDIYQLINNLTQTKKILTKKRSDEIDRRKKSIKDLKKANFLLKENVNITEEIYNKMEVYNKLERGEYDKINYSKINNEQTLQLNKPNRIVKLLGIGNDDIDNIKLNIEKEEKASLSGSECSDPYFDFDVCEKNGEV